MRGHKSGAGELSEGVNFLFKWRILAICFFCFSTSWASPIYIPNRPDLDPNLTHASGALNFTKTITADMRKLVIADLNSLYAIKSNGVSPLHRKVFGPVRGADYKSFFTYRIDSFNYDAEEVSGAIAYVGFMPYQMNITPYYRPEKIPLIARLSLFLHEARHSEDENNSWPHSLCPKPYLDAQKLDVRSIYSGLKLEGQDACDSVALGAYGVQAIFLSNIARFCTNCSDKTKVDSVLYSKHSELRITKSEPNISLEIDSKTQLH